MQDTSQEARVTRTLLDDGGRLSVLAAIFGAHFPRAEGFVFGLARTLSERYGGGLWDMYALSSGSFYMSPADDGRYAVRCGNGYESEMSADAFGVACCLYAYSHLTFSRPRQIAEACAAQYRLLREWVLSGHAEARAILAAID